MSSHSTHRQCLERRLAHSYWMPVSHSNGPPTYTLRHPASWASPTGSDTLLGSPWISGPWSYLVWSFKWVLRYSPNETKIQTPVCAAARNLLENLARLGIRASKWTNHKWKTEYCEMLPGSVLLCPRSVPGLLGWAYPEQLGLSSTACGLVLGDSIRPCKNGFSLLHRIASVAPLSKSQTMF